MAHNHFGAFDAYGTRELGGVAKWEENLARVDKITRMYDPEGDIFLSARMCLFAGLSVRSRKHRERSGGFWSSFFRSQGIIA